MKKTFLSYSPLFFLMIILLSCEKNETPFCKIQNPSNGDSTNVKKEISINVESYDTDGTIIEVRLYINGNGVVSLSEFPYSYDWDIKNESEGVYSIKATAFDNDGGNSSDMVNFKITDYCPPHISDSEGNIYEVVEIGDQCWMAENLNIGVQIDAETPQNDNGTIEKYCYDNQEVNCSIYGGLYRWDEIMEYVAIEGTKGICPDGWHVPTNEEFCILARYFDQSVNCYQNGGWQGANAGASLKAVGTIQNGDGLWEQPNLGALDEGGFAALPAGGFGIWPETGFHWKGLEGIFWTSTIDQSHSSWSWRWSVGYNNTGIVRDNFPWYNSYSIRCIRNK